MLTPKKRLSKREIKRDKLVTAWFKVNDWVTQHTREILMAVGGVALVVGLIVLFDWMKARDEQNAAEKFAQARAEYNKQNYPGAIPILEKLVSESGGTQSGELATIYLANAYLQTKDYINAEKYYKKYLDNGDDPILSIGAAFGVAATYEERGDFARAARLYEEAADDHHDSYRAPQLLISAARSYRQANQTEAARRVLQKLIDQYSKSNLVEEAKLLMAETGQASS